MSQVYKPYFSLAMSWCGERRVSLEWELPLFGSKIRFFFVISFLDVESIPVFEEFTGQFFIQKMISRAWDWVILFRIFATFTGITIIFLVVFFRYESVPVYQCLLVR